MSATIAAAATDGDAVLASPPPLMIPREILFGNPQFASPILSPDGTMLAYLAPNNNNGVLNVWVRFNATNASSARQVTNDTVRGIRTVLWAQDSKHVLYMQDQGGDENFHLYALDCTAAAAATSSGCDTINDSGSDKIPESLFVARDLTPGDNVKASSVATSKHFPHDILVSTNQRDASQFDMYRCNLLGTSNDDDNSNNNNCSTLVLDTINPGNVVGWGCRSDASEFSVGMALVRNQADSSTTIRVRNSDNENETDDDNWRDLITFPYGEEGSFIDFIPRSENKEDANHGYITSSLGRETKALLKIDLQSGKILEEISSNPTADVGGVTLDADTKAVRAVTYNYARTERVFMDPALAKDYEILEGLKPIGSEISVSSRTRDEKLWVVMFSRSDGPSEYVLYDQTEKTTTPLFVSRPELLNYTLQPMEDVRIIARDGLKLVGYLTRSATTVPPSPLVLLVHGGPWARDYWGYNAQVQWLSNRGYAVLQVNFRGSTGYGKSFLHKGDRQWGVGTMQHDLTDSVQWAIDEGIADPRKVCIYGGSYGGYACLAGLTFTPDLYACGVDIVGPSNVKTLLDSIPSYWAPLRNGMLLKIGDVDADEEFNQKISPLYHVDKIRAPLLIGQGANDPRVKQAEADQIAFSMKEKGIAVEYVLYPDEGHGFARPNNRIDFNGRVELFLQKHLAGRAEAFVRPEGSTAIFPLLNSTGTGSPT